MRITKYLIVCTLAILISVGLTLTQRISASIFNEYHLQFAPLVTALYSTVTAFFLVKRFPLSIKRPAPNVLVFAVCLGLCLYFGLFSFKHATIEIKGADIFTLMILNNGLLVKFLTAVFLAPLYEEIIFRGAFLGGLLKRNNRVVSVLVVSVLFTLFHVTYPVNTTVMVNLIGVFLSSVVFSVMYLKTNSIIVPILIHSTFNLATFTFTTTLFHGLSVMENSLVLVLSTSAFYFLFKQIRTENA